MREFLNRLLAFCLYVTLVLAFYFLSAQFPVISRYIAKPSFIDQSIPLLPWTVTIYLSHFFLVMALFFCVKTYTRVRHIFWSSVSLLVLSITFFLVVPFQIRHVPFPSQDIWSGMINLIRIFDVHTNLLPSLHVLMALFGPLFLLAAEGFSLRNALFLLWGILITLSTMTTKQHLFADVITGTLLSLFMALPWGWYSRLKVQEEERGQKRWGG